MGADLRRHDEVRDAGGSDGDGFNPGTRHACHPASEHWTLTDTTSDARMPTRPRETSLYGAVKCFLEAQGFEVKGEVCGCDIVAVRDGEPPMLVICELKL